MLPLQKITEAFVDKKILTNGDQFGWLLTPNFHQNFCFCDTWISGGFVHCFYKSLFLIDTNTLIKCVRMYLMDNLASSLRCVFSRNSNHVLKKSSEEISVEVHRAVQTVQANASVVFPCPSQWKSLELRRRKGQQYLSRALKALI